MAEEQRNEVILIDKPYTWSSFQALKKIKYAGKFKKIGHAGTLDPLATGLLILCTGKCTKDIEKYQAWQKEYTGSIMLGATRPSIDLETEIDQTYPIDHIDDALINKTKEQFLGLISQYPPAHSAVKINGKRAYELARKGEEVPVKIRQVEILAFDIETEHFPEIRFRIACSKGTYIRSLARDFGVALGSGAHLTSLRRTKIGEYSVENAWQINDFCLNEKKDEDISGS